MVVYILSSIGIATYMAHFWHSHPASTVLWIISGVCAISSIYGGVIARAITESEHKKAMLTAATVIGCLVLLGLTLSAIFLFVPAMS